MAEKRPPFRRPQTAQEAVLNELRHFIVSGRLEPGSPIRQDALASELGVSRVPVREALRILEGEGQILYRPYKGYHVAKLDIDEVAELYLIRRLLETEALHQGVPKLDDKSLAEMETLVQDMEALDPSDLDMLSRLNYEFHFLCFDSCGLSRLLHHIRMLWDASNAYRSVYFMDEEQHRQVHAEHRMLLEAAQRRDAEAVIEVFDQHRSSALAFLRQVLDSTDDDDTAPPTG